LGIDRSKVLHSAQLFASKGQFDAAINEWKKLSAESPGDGSIYNSIGELQLKRSATGEAVTAFLQAANAFRAEGATLKAIATYKKVLKLDPARYDVYRHLGDLNAERGLLSSAVQDYLTLGKYLLKERKSKEALEVYKKIVSQDPSNLDAQQRVAELCVQENMQDEATKVYLQLGRERSAQQRYAEAKEAYQSVLRIDPQNSEALQFIEHFQKTGGQPSKPAPAGTGQAAAAGKGSEPLDLLSEAARRIEEKQYAGADAILNQLLSKEPGNPQVCQLLARLHLRQGQLQVALGEYRFLAGAALRAQEYPQAEALIKEFLAVEPQSVPLLELQGELYEEQGNVEAAVQHYGQAVEVLLKHPEPGMPTLHEEIFDKIKSLAPDSAVVQKLSALMAGQAPVESAPPAAAAEPVAQEPAQPAPASETFSLEGAEPDDAWSMTSKISRGQDRHFAEPDSAPAAPAAPAQPAFSIEHAASDGAPSLAAPTVAPSAPKQPVSREAQFQSYLEGDQLVEAELWLSKLIKQGPEEGPLREWLGLVLERKGDAPGAALQYARALELGMGTAPKNPVEAFGGLYDRVKTLAPASPVVAKFAPVFAPPAPAAAPAAPAAAPPQPALPADGIDPDVHFTLGVAYKNMGLLNEAKEEFRLSMASPTVFLDSCLMTAVCLKEQGQIEAASQQLEQLLGDARCQGAKAQAIRYELGLLYERQTRWQQAMTIFESIPTFHDVPNRLSTIRAQHKPAPAEAQAFKYAS